MARIDAPSRLRAESTDDERLTAFVRALRTASFAGEVRINYNRNTLLSLRGARGSGLRLSIHRELLDEATALPHLVAWAAGLGRRVSPELRALLDSVGRRLRAARQADAPALELEPLGAPLDLDQAVSAVHARWFAHLSLPAITWSRQRHHARRNVRFACYHRGPPPLVSVSPRLGQAWVAKLFVEYVLFHELCHHAQACTPIRGENAHSARFKRWERSYPHYELALRWEREHLDRFLSA